MMQRIVVAFVDCADGFPFPVTKSRLEAFRSCAASFVSVKIASMPVLDLGWRMLRPQAIKSRIEVLSFDIANAIMEISRQRNGAIDSYEEFCIIMAKISLEVTEAMPLSEPISNWDDRSEYSYLSKRKHGPEIEKHEMEELEANRRQISCGLIKYIGQLNLTNDLRIELDDIASALEATYREHLNRMGSIVFAR
tara:strand:+ start:3690 stop:4271 length:582 start_codon:yes stop_codon:yes gene_type:complete